jgi:hypothetical protein
MKIDSLELKIEGIFMLSYICFSLENMILSPCLIICVCILTEDFVSLWHFMPFHSSFTVMCVCVCIYIYIYVCMYVTLIGQTVENNARALAQEIC